MKCLLGRNTKEVRGKLIQLYMTLLIWTDGLDREPLAVPGVYVSCTSLARVQNMKIGPNITFCTSSHLHGRDVLREPQQHSGHDPPNEAWQGLERLSIARCRPTRALLLAFGPLPCAVSRCHQVAVICQELCIRCRLNE